MAKSRRNRRYNRKRDLRMPLLIGLLAVLAVFVLVMPKEKTVKAMNVTANGVLSTHAGLCISEVMSDNASALPDENGAFGDWIEIENTLDEPMNLKGVGLSDRSDRIIFLFPDVSLAAHGEVIVFCDDVNRDAPDGVFHAKFKLSSFGESAYLFDASGVAIDSVQIPTLNSDEAYARMGGGEFEKTYDYSPGFKNGPEGHEEYMAQYAVTPGLLLINEVVPSPRSGLRDEDGDFSDWVELWNLSDEAIPLSSFALSDDPLKPVKWTFPKDAVIPANGYYIIFCSGKDKVEEATRYPHTNFSINNGEETILLSTLAGELVDRVVVSGVERDMSWGRDPDTLEWKSFTLPTPYAPNNQQGASRADEMLRAFNHTGVYISEVMSSASLITAFSDSSASDYVEIYNSSPQAWDLSGWGLSDNINWPRKWVFPQGTQIFPGEYKVILLDKSASAGSDANKLHASFGLARAGGEMLTLSDATGRVLDRLYLPRIPTDVSYGRTLGANGFFYYDAPTPGEANGPGFYGYAEMPEFTLRSGLYEGKIEVGITVPEGATVRYTTDGSIPTVENGEIYSEPFTVSAPSVFRARAFVSGLQPSETATASYIVNTYHTLDVISIVCDPDDLFSTEDGIFSDAPDPRYCTEVDMSQIPFKTPIYRSYGKIPRQGYIEYFIQDTGERAFSQGMKFALMGAYSLDMPQKSLKIRAQAALGGKYFEYPLFEDRDFTYYKSFTLRNSGNDNVWTRLADGFQSKLIDYLDTDIIHLAWKPVAVYINGSYWGHYNMRERKDRFCIAQWEGLDLEKDKEIVDQITVLTGEGSVSYGSNTEYREMVKKIRASSPGTNPEDLQYIQDNVDVDSALDWFAIEMFFGNSDPGNILFYKLPGGKWKWLVYDLDYGMYRSSFDSPMSYTKAKGMGEQLIDNTIFLKLLENSEMMDLFLTKLGNIYQTLTEDLMLTVLQECIDAIEDELPANFARWAEYNILTINSDSSKTAAGSMTYWRTRIARLRDETIPYRRYRLWEYVQTQFKLTDEQMAHYFGTRPANPDGN